MKKPKTYSGALLIIVFFGLMANPCLSQSEKKVEYLKNRISPLMGFSFIPEERREDGEPLFNIIPSIGIDYERRLSEKWALGWFNDLELTTYYIVDHTDEDKILERENAFITALTAIYLINESLSVFGGVGYEIEKHKNFSVFRVGTAYEIPIRNEWDVSFGLCWDHKLAYNSLSFAISFGKRF